MKTTLLLAIALFLISAPAPDAETIAEMTAQFIVLDDSHALQAAEADEPTRDTRSEPKTPAPVAATSDD